MQKGCLKGLLLFFSAFGFANDNGFLQCDHNGYVYFHSHTATPEELSCAAEICPIFEIDLAWAHSSFHPKIVKEKPYIGHPEEFYVEMGAPFPENNVNLQEFKQFLKENPTVKVLIDIKDEMVFSYLEEFVKEVGRERCIVHAAIKNWKKVPYGTPIDPHWYREDIELFALDRLLDRLKVPLIANCRGFSNEHVQNNNIVEQMLEDAKKCTSIVALGFYYPGAPIPKLEFLEKFNEAGYYAWINGNVSDFRKKIGKIRYIAMSDDMEQCTRF